MLWNGLAIVLFLGFATAAFIAFTTIDKQKEITIESRYGRQTSTLEIIYVNVALVLVAVMILRHSFRFMPALVAFVLFIVFNSRIRSGITEDGVYIDTTLIEWKDMEAYRIVNDEISTIQVRVYARGKRYVLRCAKENRHQIQEYFQTQNVPVREKSPK